MKESKEVKRELQEITLAMHGVSQRLQKYKCPICGANFWSIDPEVRFQMHYDFDELNEINTRHCNAAPVIVANCDGCGYSIEFNVQKAINYIPNGTGSKISEREVRARNYKAIYPSEAEMAQFEEKERELQEEIAKNDKEIARLEAEYKKKKAEKKD